MPSGRKAAVFKLLRAYRRPSESRSTSVGKSPLVVVPLASPKTAQLLARHCDINLTINTYTIALKQKLLVAGAEI
jgi:hypothetical protein